MVSVGHYKALSSAGGTRRPLRSPRQETYIKSCEEDRSPRLIEVGANWRQCQESRRDAPEKQRGRHMHEYEYYHIIISLRRHILYMHATQSHASATKGSRLLACVCLLAFVFDRDERSLPLYAICCSSGRLHCRLCCCACGS